jgi:glycosyltransferase involved in cell wall biosynthesis
MRILFYSVAEEFGGGERFLTLLVPALRARGYEAFVVCDSSNAPAALRILSNSSVTASTDDVVVLNGIGALYRWGRRLPKSAASIFIQHSLLSDDQSSYLKRMLRPLLMKFFAANITTVVRVCRAAIPDTFFPNVETIYNGVNYESDLIPLRRKGETFRLVMLGAINENKNQAEALKLLRELPQHIHLKVVGDGPLRNELAMFAYQHNISDRVEWVGFKKDPLTDLRNCHALLVLSRNEALPFSALEAMASGLPVISTKVGGMPELICNDSNGFLVDPADHGALIDRLLQLDDDEMLRYSMALNARETIRRSFTVGMMADKVIGTVLSAIARSSAK